MDISIVVPSYNEDESLPHLAEWIDRVMKEHGFSYEVIIVDDGSKDKTWQVVERLHAANPCYRGVKFRRNYGKSAALNTGFAAARGDVVITMDADLQDSPDEVLLLFTFCALALIVITNIATRAIIIFFIIFSIFLLILCLCPFDVAKV